MSDHDCGTCSDVHGAVVPTAGGVPPWCSCGWTPHGPYTVADHLRDMAAGEVAMGIDVQPGLRSYVTVPGQLSLFDL